jgi:hypothetical protein
MVALREQISALERSSMSYDKKLRELTRAHSQAEKEVAKFDRTAKKLREVSKTGDLFKSMLGSMLKFVKYGSIEFGVMTAALGALKLALVAGQYVMKAFRASLTGLGAAAGIAVAAIAAVLGGMRELQVAQMKGTFRSVYQSKAMAESSPQLAWESGRSDYSRSAEGSSRLLMGDKRFGMMSDKALQQMMMAQLNAGQQINAKFRNQLASLGDYTGGDEKAMTQLNQAMAEGAKAGKITEDVYKSLVKASPVMQRAFEEMTGGQKQAEDAAKAGSISFAKFQEVLIAGNLDALKPYQGTLDEINNTVFGKVKGALRTLKAELASISDVSAKSAYGTGPSQTILEAVKAPIDGIIRSLSGSIAAIGASLRMTVPGMLGGVNGAFDKAMERFVFYVVKGMTALDGLSTRFNGWIGNIRSFFGAIGDYIRSVTGPFDALMQNFLIPFGKFLVGTINTALHAFGGALDAQQNDIKAWGDAMNGLGGAVKLFFDALNVVKAITTPLVTVLVQIVSLVGAMYQSFKPIQPFFKALAAFALLRWGFLKGLIAIWQKFKVSLHETLAAFQKGASNIQYFRQAVNELTLAIERLNAAQRGIHVPTMTPGGGISPTTVSNLGTRTQTTFAPVSASQAQNMLNRVGANPMPLSAYGFTGAPAGPGGLSGFRAGLSSRMASMGDWYRNRRGLTPGDGPGMFQSSSRYYKSQAFNSMSPAAQEDIRAAQAAKSARYANAAIGLTVAGGMMQQSKNQVVSGAGQTASMAGMGGMMAPMMGLSGGTGMLIGAGVGLGGAIVSKTAKTRTVGQAGGRALQGAAVGAGIGAMLPGGPVTAAIGGAIGAVAGGIIGGVMAARERDRLRDKSEKDARRKFTKGDINSRAEYNKRVEGNVREKFRIKAALANTKAQEELQQQIDASYGGGSGSVSQHRKQMEQQLEQLKKEGKQYDDLRKQYYSLERAMKGNAEGARKLKDQGVILDQNFKAGNFFGFKPKQLAAYADRHGMDLSKVNLSITALIKLSGYSGDAADAMANLALSAKRLYEDLTAPLKTKKEGVQTSVDAQTAYAEYGRTMSSGGYGSKEKDTIATIDTVDKIIAAQTGALASGAIKGKKTALGQAGFGPVPRGLGGAYEVTPFQDYVNRTTTEFTDMRAQLVAHGADPTALDETVATALTPIATKQEDGTWKAKTDMATQLRYNPQIAQLMGTKTDSFNTTIMSMTEKQMAGKQGKAAVENATMETVAALRAQGVTGKQSALENQVRNSFIGQLEAKGLGTKDKIKQAFEEGSKQTKQRIEKGFEDATTKFKGKFGFKVGDKQVDVTMGDTATPRYAQTMAAHAMLNRRIPGNRTITSGIRNWGLGSINSDHLTGAAYDLTGQNLGSYAQLVKNSGGFAEFHGGSLRRHLHVVPGPLGDTASVRAPAMVGISGGASVSNNYSIVVNAPEGTSADAIADAVMMRIRREERDAMERA